MNKEEFLKRCRLAMSGVSGRVNLSGHRFPAVLGGTGASANKALVPAIGHWKAKRQARIASVAAFGYLLLGFSGIQGLVPSLFVDSCQAAGFADGVSHDRGGRVLDIVVSHGRVLRFDEPVESVFLGDPSIADIRIVSPDTVYIFGKKLGTTNLIAISGSGKVVAPGQDRYSGSPLPSLQASLRLQVVGDTAPPNEAKRELEPQSVVTIALFGRRPAEFGRARNIDEAVNIDNIAQTYAPPGQPPINAMTLDGSQQVNIRVRFAEVSRSDLQTLGISWQAFNAGNFAFGFVSNVLPGGGSKFDANSLVDALQRDGVLNILAEPNLTAVTGQTASFLAGGEIPIPVPQGGNGTAVTLQYKPFGVSLVFTPVLIKKNRIALNVRPEVSMVSNAGSVKANGISAPAFLVRRADTTLELASGQTFALGGLFQRQMSHDSDDIEKMALLGDAPVIGELFRSPRFKRNETELVILITAYLVKPISDRTATTPLNRPTDALRAVQDAAASVEAPPPSRPSVKDPGPRTGMILK
jgi:pilus assembly protein CpaC